MQLPDFVKSAKFWEAVSLIVAGALALGAFFGKLDPSWSVPSTVIFSWISSLLKMFGVELELRLRALVKEYEGLVAEQKALLVKQKAKK